MLRYAGSAHKERGEEDCNLENMDVNNTRFKIFVYGRKCTSVFKFT